jgi:TetR/AcrR family transcriptional regulator, transcriptional repressor for nem operon
MTPSASGTAAQIIVAARRRMVMQGYSGFSYADIAADVGIRKPSIHHHFASKIDLAVAAIDHSRGLIDAQRAALHDNGQSRDAIVAYVNFWERCIVDGAEPFCLAGVLAAELPNLPAEVAAAVAAHFAALKTWLSEALSRGVEAKEFFLSTAPDDEAERFMAIVYGAMLMARVSGDATRFREIVGCALRDLFVEADATQQPDRIASTAGTK